MHVSRWCCRACQHPHVPACYHRRPRVIPPPSACRPSVLLRPTPAHGGDALNERTNESSTTAGLILPMPLVTKSDLRVARVHEGILHSKQILLTVVLLLQSRAIRAVCITSSTTPQRVESKMIFSLFFCFVYRPTGVRKLNPPPRPGPLSAGAEQGRSVVHRTCNNGSNRCLSLRGGASVFPRARLWSRRDTPLTGGATSQCSDVALDAVTRCHKQMRITVVPSAGRFFFNW